MIHVCDDNRRINRDFYCSRELLLAHMCYFQEYLCGETGYDDIDIFVHCDVRARTAAPLPHSYSPLLLPSPSPSTLLHPPALARCTSSSG